MPNIRGEFVVRPREGKKERKIKGKVNTGTREREANRQPS